MKRLSLLLWLGLTLALLAAFQPAASGRGEGDRLTVEFLDVGQGDAVLILSPEGKVILVDAGPSKDVLELLKERGVKAIDLVVASHHHADHIGGMAAVIEKFEPKAYLDSGSSHTSATYKRVLQAVKDAETQFLQPTRRRERHVKVGSVLVRVFPQPPEDEDEENNNSIGLRVEYGEFSVLLTGDSEEDERDWWKEHADEELYSNVTVLKLAHHGSHNGTDGAWLNAAKPKLAVASCGKDNKYGHPHEETLRLLKKANVPLKRTDRDGTVKIETDGKTWQVVKGSAGRRAPSAASGGANERRPVAGRHADLRGPTFNRLAPLAAAASRRAERKAPRTAR